MLISRFLFKKFLPKPREDELQYGSNIQRYFSILADLLVLIIIIKITEPIFLQIFSTSDEAFDAIHKQNMKLKLNSEEMAMVKSVQTKYLFFQLLSVCMVSSILLSSWYYFSGSIGQILFGLRIVSDKDGSRLTFNQVIKRFFAGFATVATFMIGFLYSMFDKKRQSFHDKIVKTIIVTKKSLKQKNLYNPRYDLFDEIIWPSLQSFFKFTKTLFFSAKEKIMKNR